MASTAIPPVGSSAMAVEAPAKPATAIAAVAATATRPLRTLFIVLPFLFV